MADSNIISVSDLKSYKSIISNSSKPVVVRFYTTWCPVAKNTKSDYEKMARSSKQKAIFVAVDIDKLTTDVVVSTVPTYAVYHKGVIVLIDGNLKKVAEMVL